MIQLIRNDDVAADTTLSEMQSLCSICDRYGVRVIHCVTVLGAVQPIHCDMNNARIIEAAGGATVFHNSAVAQFLRSRSDEIAVHGLWHTHAPSLADVAIARQVLTGFGLPPKYYAPPFNEGQYPDTFCGLQLIQYMPRLEDFLDSGTPDGSIAYLHSWRFEKHYGAFSWERLDKCLARITKR